MLATMIDHLEPKFDSNKQKEESGRHYFKESAGNDGTIKSGAVSSLSNYINGTKSVRGNMTLQNSAKNEGGKVNKNLALRKPHESEVTGWGGPDDGLDQIQQQINLAPRLFKKDRETHSRK